ncbi:MAG: hypothetical protein H6706_27040 [Myxococcales bacterium]|nr:hypothetical protein [Myxococcales bacterium]
MGRVLGLVLLAGVAHATPGPGSVVVVGNGDDAESVALAERYAAARAVPANRVCLLPLPAVETLDEATYRDALLAPLRACLGPRVDEVEAAVLVRGVPRLARVGGAAVSTAAALGVWDSTDGADPLLGAAPGSQVPCGGGQTCLGPRWENPFRIGPFRPGWTARAGGVRWRPLLVTALDGRDAAEAEALLTSALTAEREGPEPAPFALMAGADGARGVLDGTLDDVAEALESRGIAVERLAFDADLTGRTFGAFVTGSASLGQTIEGNRLVPGAMVDNLTSFGAVPVNFTHEGETQVSVGRFIAAGAAGVHGTVAEPLNGCFPDRHFLVDLVDGSTLAEAYHRALPYVYWRNLVLGDPLAAPWAVRPVVRLAVSAAGEAEVEVEDERGILSIELYLDGDRVATARSRSRLRACLPGEGGRLLAVAEARGEHPVKGWATLDGAWAEGGCGGEDAGAPDAASSDAAPPADATVDAAAREDAGGADAAPVDAGPVDAGPIDARLVDARSVDAAAAPGASADDAGCRAAPGPSGGGPLLLLLGVAMAPRRWYRSRRHAGESAR